MKAKVPGGPTQSPYSVPDMSEEQFNRTRDEWLAMFKEMSRTDARPPTQQDAVESSGASVALAETNRKRRVRLRATATVTVILLIAALVKIAYVANKARPEPSADSVALQHSLAKPSPPQEHPPAALSPLSMTSLAPKSGDSATDIQFARAFVRLGNAFTSFPGESQADIVREVNEKHPGRPMTCSLVWRDGSLALYVGSKNDVSLSLTATLNQCAAAVEKLHTEQRRKSRSAQRGQPELAGLTQ